MRSLEVSPNGENATVEELGVAMEAAPNKRSYMRLAAVRALLLGVARSQVCLLYQRSDRWVRLWVELFNRGGIDALASKPRPGRPRKVKFERLQDLLIPVLAGRRTPLDRGQAPRLAPRATRRRVRLPHRDPLLAPTGRQLARATDLA
jgi:hypothetical protein